MTPRTEALLAWIGAVCSVAVAAFLSLEVPRFKSLLDDFGGVDRPALTNLVFHYYPAAWILPIMVLIAWLGWSPRERRGVAAFSIGVGGSVLIFLLSLLAVHLAVNRAAATI